MIPFLLSMSISWASLTWNTSSLLASVRRETFACSRKQWTLSSLVTALVGSCLSRSEFLVTPIKPSPTLSEAGAPFLVNKEFTILTETWKVTPDILSEMVS